MANWYSFLELSEICFQYFPSEVGCFYGCGTSRHGGPTEYSLTYALVGRTLVYHCAKQHTWSTMSLNLTLSKAGLWRRLSTKELMLLNCGVGEDSWESLGLQGDPTSHSKGDQPWVFFGGNDDKAETPVLWSPHVKSWLTGKDSDAGRDWGQEEGDNRGWDGWMASPTRCTWVWVNSGRWWWTGRPGVLRFMGSQRVGHDWWTELNWTEKYVFGVTLRIKLHSFVCGYLVVLASFVEKTVVSALNGFGIFVGNQMTVDVWVYCRALPLICSVCPSARHTFDLILKHLIVFVFSFF